MSLLYGEVVSCPSCGLRTFHYAEVLYEAPHFGKIVISAGRCPQCGYRYFDVDYAEVGRPTRVVFRARDGEDVARSYLVRSKTGSISSPDLGFSLEPGSAAEPMVTTVEGFLYRVVDYAERLKILNPEAEERVDQFIGQVYRKMEEGGFTLIVEDPLGKSLVIPRRPDSIEIQ